MRIVYVDVLFLVNFVMDHVLLALTAELRGSGAAGRRMALGAAAGAVLAVFLFFAPEGILGRLLRPVCCGLMVRTAFGRQAQRRFLGDCAMVYALSMLLSGGVLRLGQMLPGAGSAVSNTVVYLDVSVGVLALGTLLGYGLITWACRPGSFRAAVPHRKIWCRAGGREAVFQAFTDTGNLLRDPVSGKKVILLSASLAGELLGAEAARALAGLSGNAVDEVFAALAGLGLPVGLLPCTASLGRGLLITLRPEALTVDGQPAGEYILGISCDEVAPACGCRALIGV